MAASPSLLEDLHGLPVARGVITDEQQLQGRRRVALVSGHLSAVWRFLRRLGLSPEDSDDVAQEVFLVAVGKLDQIQQDQEKRFLFGIAIRMASRARRSQKARSARAADAVELDDVRSPDLASDEVLARKEARATLDEILAAMTPDLRTAFVLFELEEMTMAEISAMTDTALGTVASRLRRAREQFQQAASARQPRQA
jgi:RNA polymerase sigma-70 factor, ECF subfamily